MKYNESSILYCLKFFCFSHSVALLCILHYHRDSSAMLKWHRQDRHMTYLPSFISHMPPRIASCTIATSAWLGCKRQANPMDLYFNLNAVSWHILSFTLRVYCFRHSILGECIIVVVLHMMSVRLYHHRACASSGSHDLQPQLCMCLTQHLH